MTDDLIIGNIVIPAEKRTRCEVFSRIIGYLRPVAQWNKGKQAEWPDRVTFVVPKDLEVRNAEKRP
jgi:ribonucleoside-triphosphate reductase